MGECEEEGGGNRKVNRGIVRWKLTYHARNSMQRSLALLLDGAGARPGGAVEHFGVDCEALLCVWWGGR